MLDDTILAPVRAEYETLLDTLGKGSALPRSQPTKVRDDISELRTNFGKEQIRILCCVEDDRVLICLVLVHKKDQELRRQDIDLAARRLREWRAK